MLALPTLDYLLRHHDHSVVGLATPDYQHEANQRVLQLSQQHNIPYVVLEQRSLKRSMSTWLQQCRADVVFVLTFPFRIPDSVLTIPKHGFINFHPGMLPQYRGPDPTFWQIRNGEKIGGFTIHRMDAEFDTGPILHVEQLPIDAQDTYGAHANKLASTAVLAMNTILEQYPNWQFHPQVQSIEDQSRVNYLPRPELRDLIIDWDRQPARDIQTLVRACNPEYTGAITYFRHQPVRIFQCSVRPVADAKRKSGAQRKTDRRNASVINNATAGSVLIADPKEGISILTSDQKLLRLGIVYTDVGFLTGGQFVRFYDIKAGEQLENVMV